eukprot:scaffold7916_cov286-Pinguiococcus_pyrenoidosus.AAC.1
MAWTREALAPNTTPTRFLLASTLFSRRLRHCSRTPRKVGGGAPGRSIGTRALRVRVNKTPQ